MKIFLIIVACLAVVVIGVLIAAAMKPDTFSVVRSTTINAPADKIYALINDYRQWTAWSPWETKDPDMKRTFSANTAGKGATYAWEGNNNVGAGNMVILDSVPSSKIAIALNMEKPIAANNHVTFVLTPASSGTAVTWSMQGPVPYFAKIIHVFLNMDKMVGGDFEEGLAKMKAAAERG